jgi:hypothetical protein
MVIKSLPMDDMNTIVFAVRGTQTFMDWAVNLKTAPAFADGFLVSIFSSLMMSASIHLTRALSRESVLTCD